MMCLLSSGSCSNSAAEAGAQVKEQAPDRMAGTLFSGDSAMALVRGQVAMGPRVPGSAAHAECTRWIASRLEESGAEVSVQRGAVTQSVTGKRFEIANVFGRIRPEAPVRVLLVAHYDTRPTADEEEDAAKRDTPIDGANDGASGVAVVLELARMMTADTLLANVGADLLLVDAEDSGLSGANADDTWSLGARYWADNMPYAGFGDFPVAGIVFDMVGGRGARFHREYFSSKAAPGVVNAVWAAAAAEGLGDRFPNQVGGPIIDDHLPLLQAGIDCIDIVENKSDVTGSFPPTWHTLQDNADNIDPATMQAVGRAVQRYLRGLAR